MTMLRDPMGFNPSLLSVLENAGAMTQAWTAARQSPIAPGSAKTVKQMASVLRMAGLPVEAHAAAIVAESMALPETPQRAAARASVVDTLAEQVRRRHDRDAESTMALWGLTNTLRETMGLSPDDAAAWIDLAPVMMPSPSAIADAPRNDLADRLGLGLHHAAKSIETGDVDGTAWSEVYAMLDLWWANAHRPAFAAMLALLRPWARWAETADLTAEVMASRISRCRMEVERWRKDAVAPRLDILRECWTDLLRAKSLPGPSDPLWAEIDRVWGLSSARAELQSWRGNPDRSHQVARTGNWMESLERAWSQMSTQDADASTLQRALLGLHAHRQQWPEGVLKAPLDDLMAVARDAMKSQGMPITDAISMEGAILILLMDALRRDPSSVSQEAMLIQRQRLLAARENRLDDLAKMPRPPAPTGMQDRSERTMRQRVLDATDMARVETEERINGWRGDGTILRRQDREALSDQLRLGADALRLLGCPWAAALLIHAAERMDADLALERPPTPPALDQMERQWGPIMAAMGAYLQARRAEMPDAHRFLSQFGRLDPDGRLAAIEKATGIRWARRPASSSTAAASLLPTQPIATTENVVPALDPLAPVPAPATENMEAEVSPFGGVVADPDFTAAPAPSGALMPDDAIANPVSASTPEMKLKQAPEQALPPPAPMTDSDLMPISAPSGAPTFDVLPDDAIANPVSASAPKMKLKQAPEQALPPPAPMTDSDFADAPAPSGALMPDEAIAAPVSTSAPEMQMEQEPEPEPEPMLEQVLELERALPAPAPLVDFDFTDVPAPSGALMPDEAIAAPVSTSAPEIQMEQEPEPEPEPMLEQALELEPELERALPAPAPLVDFDFTDVPAPSGALMPDEAIAAPASTSAPEMQMELEPELGQEPEQTLPPPAPMADPDFADGPAPSGMLASVVVPAAEIVSPITEANEIPAKNEEVLSDSRAPTPADPAPVEAPPPESEATTGGWDILERKDFVEAFREEVESMLAMMDRAMDALRRDAMARGPLGDMVRGYHTIKGSGRLVGYRLMGRVAERIEHALRPLRQMDASRRIALVSIGEWWRERVVAISNDAARIWVDTTAIESALMTLINGVASPEITVPPTPEPSAAAFLPPPTESPVIAPMDQPVPSDTEDDFAAVEQAVVAWMEQGARLLEALAGLRERHKGGS